MKIQLALDRLSIAEAISVASAVGPYVDWIEVGTSLIKEFGMDSVRAMREAFPRHIILADMKTFDNAVYEMKMCFEAGANVATVMAAAPKATIVAAKKVADEFGQHIMLDLLATESKHRESLADIAGVTWCYHVSKDEQELLGGSAKAMELGDVPIGIDLAVAGGITLDMIPALQTSNVDVAIVGSAITKADEPKLAAKAFRDAAQQK